MNFSLKPVFVGWITLLVQLPLQLFLTFWFALFFGGIVTLLFAAFAATTGNSDFDPEAFFSISTFVDLGLLAFCGIPLIAYFGKKLNYAHTEYRFFDDRLEFEEGFLTVSKKVIRYSDVKEVTLRKGVLQRMCGLGTIYLATMATGATPQSNSFNAFGFSNVSASGISIRDILDSDQEYEKIRTLVSRHA